MKRPNLQIQIPVDESHDTQSNNRLFGDINMNDIDKRIALCVSHDMTLSVEDQESKKEDDMISGEI